MADAADQGKTTLVGHKTAMLRDLERGRPLDPDTLATPAQEPGRL